MMKKCLTYTHQCQNGIFEKTRLAAVVPNQSYGSPHKVAIAEFGLSKLMLIFLNHYMFIEVMRYLHDNRWFGSQ